MGEDIKGGGTTLTVFLTGVAVEFVLTLVKDEPVNPVRVGTMLAIIAILLAVSGLARRKDISWRRVVAGGLIVIGALSFLAGLVILFSDGFVKSHAWVDVIGAAVSSSGVIVFLSGFYVAMQRGVVQRDDPEEYQDREGGQTYPLLDSGGGTATLTTFEEKPNTSVVNLCRQQIGVADLHFVAYYVNGESSFCADVLNDSNDRMRNLSGRVSPETRRRRYEAYGRLSHGMVARLDDTFDEVQQGDLIRVVLDVEQGAFYYVHIDKFSYLFGVTLDQDKVNIVDDKLRDLAVAIAQLTGKLSHTPLKPAPSGPVPGNIVPMQRPSAQQDEPA
jgi:hypothetical protein